MKTVNAISTHHGDSWPAQQPPSWHSGDSCGSVPCALPVNCAACSFVHSSCTCEVYPLWREFKISVLSVPAKAKLTDNFWGSIYMLFRLESLPPPHWDLDNKSPRLKDRKKIRRSAPLVRGEILNQIHALTVSKMINFQIIWCLTLTFTLTQFSQLWLIQKTNQECPRYIMRNIFYLYLGGAGDKDREFYWRKPKCNNSKCHCLMKRLFIGTKNTKKEFKWWEKSTDKSSFSFLSTLVITIHTCKTL